MLTFIPSQAREFLEIGCGSGVFGGLIRDLFPESHVIGIELHPEAAAAARQRLDKVIEKPVEQALDEVPDGSIDCIVCNDVLEHLVDPWAVLVQIRKKLRPGGQVVSSIPNVRYFPVFREYLDGEWRYRNCGVLDQTHLRFFTQASIRRLFAETGYNLDVIEGIFPQPLPWKANLLNRLLGGTFDDMKFERFACRCTPKPCP